MNKLQHISRGQCKAARALLGWNQERLAVMANVGKQTVADYERGARWPIRNNMIAIKGALEGAGIKFMQTLEGEGAFLRHYIIEDGDA